MVNNISKEKCNYLSDNTVSWDVEMFVQIACMVLSSIASTLAGNKNSSHGLSNFNDLTPKLHSFIPVSPQP